MKSKFLLTLLTATATASVLSAALTVPGKFQDNDIFAESDGDGNNATNVTLGNRISTNLRVGDRLTTEGTKAGVAVMVFSLPELAPGESVGSASLVYSHGPSDAALPFGVDLYGLGFRSEADVFTSDFYIGSLDTTDAVLIADSFFTSGSTLVRTTSATTNLATNAALASYLNDQYNLGAVGSPDGTGDFVFLRFNPDAFLGATADGFALFSQDAGSEFRPTLELSIVPEPQQSALLAAVSLFLACIGLRRRR